MKTTKITVILLLLIAITTSTYAQEMQMPPDDADKYTARRDPLLAAGLSLLTLGFGGGQYYNKQYVKGGILTGINTGVIVWALLRDEGDGFLAGLEEVLGIMAVMAITTVYSTIDAPINASKINKKYGLVKQVSLVPSLERNKWDANRINAGLKLTLSLN